MNILIVGAGGYVGTSVRPALEYVHRCRHFDIKPIAGVNSDGIVGDVTDVRLARFSVREMDAVLYMAMGSLKDDIALVRESFDVNVQGLYVFLDAAAHAGVKRFVYISTLSVYRSPDDPRDESIPADAWNAYGLSKRIGEFICGAAAQQFPGLCAVSLRLMYPRNEKDWPDHVYDPKKGDKQFFALGPNDTRRLFLAALECRQPGSHIVQATGDLNQQRFPHRRVYDLLGWRPQGN